MSRKLPREIRFNPLDRYYLTPRNLANAANAANADDYFPMSLVCTVALKRAYSADEVRAAIARVDAKIPQFRLRYRLDASRERWVLVPDAELAAHYESLAVEGADGDPDAQFADALAGNIQPLTQGVRFVVCGRRWRVHAHHALYGGAALNALVAAVIGALADPAAFEALPAPAVPMESPLWRVVWATPQAGIASWMRWGVGVLERVRGLSDRQASAERNESVQPIVTRVYHQVLPEPCLRQMEQMRAAISRRQHVELKVLLQVLVARWLTEAGAQPTPSEYTFVVDVRRYLRASTLIGGNTSAILSLAGDPSAGFADECDRLQTQYQAGLRARTALMPILNQWLIGLFGARLRQRLSQRQLSQPPTVSASYFELNYLGKIRDFDAIGGQLAADAEYRLAGSLENTTPLIVVFGVIGGQGYLTAIYNANLVADATARGLCDFLTDELALDQWMRRHSGGASAGGSTDAFTARTEMHSW